MGAWGGLKEQRFLFEINVGSLLLYMKGDGFSKGLF